MRCSRLRPRGTPRKSAAREVFNTVALTTTALNWLRPIEIAVTSIDLLFQKNGAAEFFSSLLIKVLGLLFAYTLLVEAPDWIPTIIHSFTQAGSAIGHVGTLDPSAVIDQGIAVAN